MKTPHIALLAAVIFVGLGACKTTEDTTTTTAASVPAEPARPSGGRLPSDVRPLAYQLALDVNPNNEDFTGRVDITIELDQPRAEIWLHSEGLTVTVARGGAGGERLDAIFIPEADGFARVVLPRELPAGRATLSLAFAGRFDEGLDVLYRVTAAGDAYAFTQMEALSARKAFPCFDEPGFKTPFDVALTIPTGMSAAANGPLEKKKDLDNGRTLWRFATTRPLPTYLFALTVGALDLVDAPPLQQSAVRDHEIPVRGIATRGRGGELAYALAELPKIVALLEDYFGTPYPYAKLDVVAVPDFAAGAMENAGLVTFRDGLLLLDTNHAPLSQRQTYAEIMAHELAHMWFGNLVTMAWWDDLWLNEAFATWVAYKVTDLYEPAWGIDTTMLVSTHEAMQQDSLVAARRIREPIKTAGDILNAFDGITYSKGGAVIAMFERWVGEAAFKRGVRAYLQQHADGNATVDDLLYQVSVAAGFDVATPFRTFLDQPGVPLLEVTPVCTEGEAHLDVRQSRFLPLGSGGDKNATWQVPLCVRYGTSSWEVSSCTLVTEASQRVPLEAGCPTWLHPNADGAGYYRWTLPGDALAALAARADELTPKERLSLAGSVGAAFAAGTTDTDDVLRALEPLANDPEPAVALVPLAAYEVVINHLLDDDDARARARTRLARLYLPATAALGMDKRPGEDPKTSGRRALATDALVRVAGDGPTMVEASRRARAFFGLREDGSVVAMDLDAISPDLVESALIALVRTSDERTFNQLRARLLREKNPLLRRHLLRALSSALRDQPAAAARSLIFLEEMRTNEWYVPGSVQMRDARTRESSWHFVQNQWANVKMHVPEMERGYLPYAAQGLCSDDDAAAVEAFFAPKLGELFGGERPLAQVTEGIRLCAALRSRHAKDAQEIFAPRQ